MTLSIIRKMIKYNAVELSEGKLMPLRAFYTDDHNTEQRSDDHNLLDYDFQSLAI